MVIQKLEKKIPRFPSVLRRIERASYAETQPIVFTAALMRAAMILNAEREKAKHE